MVRFIVPRLLVILLFPFAASVIRADGDFYRYEATAVADGIHLFRGSNLAGTWVTGNVVLIVNEHDAVVLDSDRAGLWRASR